VGTGHELATQIASDPDDDSAYLVYADWLQAQSDPLGELIILEHRLARGEDVTRERWQFLDRHRGYLLGPMAHRVDLFERAPRKLGFLRSLPREDLAGWLAAPVARFALAVVASTDAEIAALAASPVTPPLRSLALQQDDYETLLDLSWLWSRFPALERIEIEKPARLGAVDLPHAHTVMTGATGYGHDTAGLAAIAAASWPALGTLHLGVNASSHDVLAPLLAGTRTPRLQRLVLQTYTSGFDTIIAQLASSSLLPRLQQLELSSWVKLDGAAATTLAETADRFRHLQVFDFELGKRVRTRDRKPLQALRKPPPNARLSLRAFGDGF
jgi:uncharacterized protein (TIGR02996 family)